MPEPRAIKRRQLSRPLRLALEAGALKRGQSYHDVGEGRGDDVRQLKRRGIGAKGHDPYYSPRKKWGARADVVGLVYVLNTIADPAIRSQLLRRSYRHAKKALLVATRTDKAEGKRYRDGVLTSADSFQRNWTAEQIRRYVRRILGRAPEQLAPGVLIVAKGAR